MENDETDQISAPPRRVPWTWALRDVFHWSSKYVWVIFTLATSVIAFFDYYGLLITTLLSVVIVVLYLVRVAKRLRLLKWGKVALSVRAEKISEATYFSGLTYRNMSVPTASGWEVDRSVMSGPQVVEMIKYETQEGTQGQFKLKGQGYDDGIVLYNFKRPTEALCVESFPYDLDRDDEGNWDGSIGFLQWLSILSSIILTALWAGGLWWLWMNLDTLSI